MFLNFELEISIMVLLLLIVISMIPIIQLKYNSDLYENIEKFNKYCLNNDAKLLSELDVKDTYMWNMSSYIYDVDNLSNFFYKRNEIGTGTNDYIGLNRNAAKVSVNNKQVDNIMKIYNYYLYMSLGFFIVLILFFISQANILINIGATSDYKICMEGEGSVSSGDNKIFEVFKSYFYVLFLYVALFIVFFSLILKKLTELYADTDTYEYIMLMKELDILLKENKPSNEVITKILRKYSKNKIDDISHIALNNKAVINELLAKPYKNKATAVKYDNNENYKITLKNIEKIEYYNSKEAKDKVKNKVSDIFQFIYVYIIFLIVPIYMLSISLQGNYMYLLFAIIAIIIFSVSVYNIYNTLQ
jgi:hypothetical protein